MRTGGFAAYSIATEHHSEANSRWLLDRFPASVSLPKRAILRAVPERQTRTQRFRLHRDAYLAGVEATWVHIHDAVPP